MGTREVQAAFDILTEEIDSLVPEFIRRGNLLNESRSFDQARKMIDQAETMEKFKTEVNSLREQWNNLVSDIPINLEALAVDKAADLREVADESEQPVTETSASKLGTEENSLHIETDANAKTHKSVFYIPILEALVMNHGSMESGDLFAYLEETLGNNLTVCDKKPLSTSGNSTIRWTNTVHWARRELVMRGLLYDTIGTTDWSITSAGKQYLLNNKMSSND